MLVIEISPDTLDTSGGQRTIAPVGRIVAGYREQVLADLLTSRLQGGVLTSVGEAVAC
jgi:hypothetical protein